MTSKSKTDIKLNSTRQTQHLGNTDILVHTVHTYKDEMLERFQNKLSLLNLLYLNIFIQLI